MKNFWDGLQKYSMMISQQIFTVIIVHIRHTIYSSESSQKLASNEHFRELIPFIFKSGTQR
jgi:hypothetical protein